MRCKSGQDTGNSNMWLMSEAGIKSSAMKFLTPHSKYQTLDETAMPTNSVVTLEIVPAGRRMTVQRFSGNFNMKRATEEATSVSAVLKHAEEKI